MFHKSPKILTLIFLSFIILQTSAFLFLNLFYLPSQAGGAGGSFDSNMPYWKIPDIPTLGSIVNLSQGLDCSQRDTQGNPVCKIPWIAEMVRDIYKYAIGIVGILAAVVLMFGGVLWLVSAGNATRVGEAKAWIGASIIGLVLALTSYMILYQINPALLQFKPMEVTQVEKKKGSSFPEKIACLFEPSSLYAATPEEFGQLSQSSLSKLAGPNMKIINAALDTEVSPSILSSLANNIPNSSYNSLNNLSPIGKQIIGASYRNIPDAEIQAGDLSTAASVGDLVFNDITNLLPAKKDYLSSTLLSSPPVTITPDIPLSATSIDALNNLPNPAQKIIGAAITLPDINVSAENFNNAATLNPSVLNDINELPLDTKTTLGAVESLPEINVTENNFSALSKLSQADLGILKSIDSSPSVDLSEISITYVCKIKDECGGCPENKTCMALPKGMFAKDYMCVSTLPGECNYVFKAFRKDGTYRNKPVAENTSSEVECLNQFFNVANKLKDIDDGVFTYGDFVYMPYNY